MEERVGFAVIGELVGSRRNGSRSTAWLADRAVELTDAFGPSCLVPFESTSDGAIRGLISADADPLDAVLRAALAEKPPELRWAIAPVELGCPEPFATARQTIARLVHDRLAIVTGDPASDELLDDLAPVLVDLLDGLTPRQRAVARLAFVEDLRQSAVADRLGVRRATVSVSFARARIHSTGRLIGLLRRTIRYGTDRTSGTAGPGVDAGKLVG